MKKSLFSLRVVEIVLGIRKGQTLTYREVASRAGNPRSARVVGKILSNYFRECERTGKKTIPCHRVIRSDGKIGGYARGEKEKIRLLKSEGAIKKSG
jgi:O-6-methylguanine DNA methyltransferase